MGVVVELLGDLVFHFWQVGLLVLAAIYVRRYVARPIRWLRAAERRAMARARAPLYKYRDCVLRATGFVDKGLPADPKE
jgi:hypothetical protein